MSRKRRKRCFYIGTLFSWSVVTAHNKREVKSAAIQRYGRGRVMELRLATLCEVRDFLAEKGDDAIEDVSK